MTDEVDYKAKAIALWQLLDDIDTGEDMCKSNDAAFRKYARVKHQARHKILMSPDGYALVDPVTGAIVVDGDRPTRTEYPITIVGHGEDDDGIMRVDIEVGGPIGRVSYLPESLRRLAKAMHAAADRADRADGVPV